VKLSLKCTASSFGKTEVVLSAARMSCAWIENLVGSASYTGGAQGVSRMFFGGWRIGSTVRAIALNCCIAL
jgi:hypothetical protein